MLCGFTSLNIGQIETCEVRIPDVGNCEPMTYAMICPAKDEQGWLIVKRSDLFDLRVNGKLITLACKLNDGDEIEFIDASCLLAKFSFKIFDDGDYNAASGVSYKQKSSLNITLISTVVVALVAVAIALFALLDDGNSIAKYDFGEYSGDICQITTDSVFLMSGSQVIESVCLEQAAQGTCFLTDSGIFVTARHCVEPWINDEDWDGTVTDAARMSPALRLATKAETMNRLLGEERYGVRSHCVISYGVQQFEYYSTDFVINKSRDKVLCLGDENNPIYWRTIIPIASCRDMELGDFAYVRAPQFKGAISMAGVDDLAAFSKSNDKDVVVIGYPINNNNSNILTKVDGKSQQLEWNDDNSALIGCIQMTALINPGNSGGPIFALIDDKPKVVGIVSKADTYAQQGTFWAVPSTEIIEYCASGGASQNDTLIFRR